MTVDPDAISAIHHINLKNNKLIGSKKLALKDEEYTRSGLPSNPSLTYYNGYLYYAVNKIKVIYDDRGDEDINNGSLVKIDPKTLNIVK